MSSTKGGLFFLFLFCVIFTSSGCDLINPKPKNVKPAKATAPVQATENISKNTESKKEALPKDVVAKVGAWTLNTAEFNERLQNIKQVMKDFDENNMEARRMVLDELIRQQLLVHEAKQEKLDQMTDIQAAVKDFENTLLVQELATRLTKDIKATDQEARDYYNANPDQFIEPVEKQLREIVVTTQAEAKDILVQVLQGADFMQIAKDKSKGKTAANGGDLGFVTKAPFEQMQKAVEALKKGDVSTVFEGPQGYYLVKVEDVKGGAKRSFDDIKEDVVKFLTVQKQQQAILIKMDEIAKKVNIQVNPDLLKDEGERTHGAN